MTETVNQEDLNEIKYSLFESQFSIRIDWAKRLDFAPNPEQIERGLTD